MSGFRRRNQRSHFTAPFGLARSSGQAKSPEPGESHPPAGTSEPAESSGSAEPFAPLPPPFPPFDPPTPFDDGAHEPAAEFDLIEPSGPAEPVEPLEVVEAAGESAELVRPYVITNGRGLTGNDKFNLITLVTAADRPRPAHFDPEKHRLLDLCGGGMLSVAEIAGHMRLPIGIVKVLLSDLSTEGYVVVRPPVPRAQLADVSLLQEVLDGLQARFG